MEIEEIIQGIHPPSLGQIVTDYVHMREAEVQLETAKRWHTQVALAAMGADVKQECKDMIAGLESALAAARQKWDSGR